MLSGGQTVQSLARRSPGSPLGFLCATVIQINLTIWFTSITDGFTLTGVTNEVWFLTRPVLYLLDYTTDLAVNLEASITFILTISITTKEKRALRTKILQFLHKTPLRLVVALSEGEKKKVRLKPKNWSVCHSDYNKLWNTVQGKTKSHLNK